MSDKTPPHATKSAAISGITRRRFGLTFAGAGAACLAPLLAGCAGPVHSLRYKLALEVETPEGLKTGASVIELRAADGPRSLAGLGAGHSGVVAQRGEAVAVDLGQRGVLFALLSADGNRKKSLQEIDFVFAAFPREGRQAYDEIMRGLAKSKPKTQIPLDILPMLVRFRDIADPKSVERVDPNNLAAAFGPGVTLKRATLEITDQPITTGIEKRLGWLRGMMTNIDGTSVTTSNALPNTLNSGDFRKF